MGVGASGASKVRPGALDAGCTASASTASTPFRGDAGTQRGTHLAWWQGFEVWGWGIGRGSERGRLAGGDLQGSMGPASIRRSSSFHWHTPRSRTVSCGLAEGFQRLVTRA